MSSFNLGLELKIAHRHSQIRTHLVVGIGGGRFATAALTVALALGAAAANLAGPPAARACCC